MRVGDWPSCLSKSWSVKNIISMWSFRYHRMTSPRLGSWSGSLMGHRCEKCSRSLVNRRGIRRRLSSVWLDRRFIRSLGLGRFHRFFRQFDRGRHKTCKLSEQKTTQPRLANVSKWTKIAWIFYFSSEPCLTHHNQRFPERPQSFDSILFIIFDTESFPRMIPFAHEKSTPLLLNSF